jgi:hypothetical protein
MLGGVIDDHLSDEVQVEDDEYCVEEDFHFVEGELGGVWGYRWVFFAECLMLCHVMIMAEKEKSNYQRYFPLRLCYVTRLSSYLRRYDFR